MTREVIAVCSEIHTNQISILCDQNVGYLAVNTAVQTGLGGVNVFQYCRRFMVYTLIRVDKEHFTKDAFLHKIYARQNYMLFLQFFLNLIFVVPSIMLYSSEISPTRCNNCGFILRNGFTLHVSCDNLTHHQEYIRCIWPQVSRLT